MKADNRKQNPNNDGTIDDDYTWDRPVTVYVSTLQHLQLLLLKARVRATGVVDERREAA